MGIAFSDSDSRLQADYSMTVNEGYKVAAEYNLKKYGSLDIICNEERYMCHCIHSKHLSSGLPSWVTDWTCLAEIKKIRSHYVQPTAYSGMKAKLNLRIDEDVLTCTGLVLGSINRTKQRDVQRQRDDPAGCLLGFLRRVMLFSVGIFISRVRKITEESVLLIMIPIIREIYRLFSSWPRNEETLLFKNLSSAISEEEFFTISVLVSKPHDLPNNLSIKLKALLDTHQKLGVWWQFNMDHLLHGLLFSMEAASTTSLGIGMCPNFCRKEDIIALLYGCNWPVAIRAAEVRKGQFEILGPVQIGKDLNTDAISECEERDFSFV
jgi:hypothetical protein